jgi:hypothetical protein
MSDPTQPIVADPMPTHAPGDWIFLLKVLGLSALIAVGIKWVGPMLPIGPTNLNATVAIVTPSMVLATIFLARLKRS